jgi:hypothetical protein
MPLRWPLSPQAEVIDDSDLFRGVLFAMFDGEKRVACSVSYEALSDRARLDQLSLSEGMKDIFLRNRARIAELASKNYDAGQEQPIVTSQQLNSFDDGG